MSYWPFILNVGIMIGAPLLVARHVQTRRQPGWSLFGVGAATFVLAQLLHIPFNWFVLTALKFEADDLVAWPTLLGYAAFLGLSSGLFEEVARYLTLRAWVPEARSWGQGLMLGAGHGGIEAILVGILAAINYGVLAGIRTGKLLDLIPAEQLSLVKMQAAAVFDLPWHAVLMASLERLLAICLHLALSLLVMQQFVRGQRRWLPLAIGWHALANGVVVIVVLRSTSYAAEGALSLFALVSLGIIFALRAPEPAAPILEPLPAVAPLPPLDIEPTMEALERSRFG